MTIEAAPEAKRTALAQVSRRRFLSNEVLLVTAITLLGLAIRLYKLDTIPAEMWGDVIEHHYLASQVMGGDFYLDYQFGGDGPMLSYIIAGLSFLFSLTFFTIKLSTVLAGTALIPLDYLLTKQLFGRRVAGMAALLTAISFWAITFSRQGKPYILAAVFAALAVWLVLSRRPILAGVAVGLGMYTQAAFWGLPLAFLTAPMSLFVAAVFAIPFIVNFARNPSALTGSGSYIGSKLHEQHSMIGVIGQVLDNIWKDALSFNFRGDTVFRDNIPLHPNLDRVSGAFFLIGVVLILLRIVYRRDWRLLYWLVIPFAVIQIPAVLDQTPTNVPNMGRIVGAVPFTMATIAYAVDRCGLALFVWLRRYGVRPRLLTGSSIVAVLIAIFAINVNNYFEIYPRTLPNGNTPFGRMIAQRIDRTSPRTYSFVIGCCWGDWGQPEPGAVTDVVDKRRYVLTVDNVIIATQMMQRLRPGSPVLLFMSPGTPLVVNGMPLRVSRKSMLRRNGWNVAWVVSGRTI